MSFRKKDVYLPQNWSIKHEPHGQHLFHALQNSKITYRPHRPETSGETFLYVILLKPNNNETIFVDFSGSSAI